IAPHPDDEVLGCGGLIAEAVRQGSAVRVVSITAGDGFSGAATFASRTKPTPEDYLGLGILRTQELRHACRLLGLQDEDVVLLGYPDRGLWRMLQNPNRPTRSATTQTNQVPYPDALSPRKPYTVPALIDDLKRVLKEFQPTDVFVSHPLDDHPDHMASALLVREALEQAYHQDLLIQRPRLYYYIVHRGDWPLPQGEHPQRDLTPPLGLTYENWQILHLSQDAQDRKRRALMAHESQVALMPRFLTSFLRQNELFLPAEAPRHIYRNPVDDGAMLRLRPNADLSQVEVYPHRLGLEVVVETHKPLGNSVQIDLTLIGIDAENQWKSRRWRIDKQSPLVYEQSGNRLTLWIPDAELKRYQRAYLVVQTRLYGVEIDRSGVLPIP
ncbi:MAG: PIG-L family deacetylase, partial [Fimbriimonadales bacterium]